MTQQISNETKTRIVAITPADIAKLSLPFLALVMPKTLDKPDIVALPAYWLQPLNMVTSSRQSKLPPAVVTILTEVLTESLLEDLWISYTDDLSAWTKQWSKLGFKHWAEKQFLPGVTDNSAHVVEEALSLQDMSINFKVASGTVYLSNKPEAFHKPEYRLYHPVVERFQIHDLSTKNTNYFPFPTVILDKPPAPETISLDLSNEELLSLSKNRVLALTTAEMLVIKKHYADPQIKSQRTQAGLSPWPSDVELEIIAQTWSEHCKHKIFNASISMTDTASSGKASNSTITSLYKSYIQKVTKQLQSKRKDLLSVFKDNSGVVQWNDKYAICFKVETHNSPSALEPYGGALTGILGVNRDILGTGLGAKPIFNTDILCFAYPSADLPQRPKLLPPEMLIEGVRKGIQDGGNKSGIPTVNGAIVFHPGYRAKPLVFCGTGGLLPLEVSGICAYEKHTRSGDTIVMAGGRVGKDGVHGATFSSEALHEGSPVSAVQIGDPFTQKRLIDFVLAARDQGLITGITDNGAGGLSSSVGEMATITGGATINLDNVPTKYPGLAAWEIIVSESQERMTISTNNFAALQNLAKKYNVEISNIGTFNASGILEISHGGKIIAALNLDFLHDGVPQLQLEAQWTANYLLEQNVQTTTHPTNLNELLLRVLAHPNICSREAIIRQYDHEVLGMNVIKPLMGENQLAACDAAVITPILGETTGLVISNGLCPQFSHIDPYFMAQAALDEAIRNAVCVGADPESISILDNFCWPDPVDSPNNPEGKTNLGILVKSCEGLYDAALFMETPLISGKDSMKNDFDDGVIRLSVPPTLLISAIGKVPDISHCLTSQFKNAGDYIFLLSAGTLGSLGCTTAALSSLPAVLPSLDLKKAKLLYHKLHQAISKGLINSAHDISDGGLLTTLSESMIGSNLGARLTLDSQLSSSSANDNWQHCLAFSTLIQQLDSNAVSDQWLSTLLLAEGPGHIVVTVTEDNKDAFLLSMTEQNLLSVGTVTDSAILEINVKMKETSQQYKWQLSELRNAWTTPLPFA